MNVNSIKCTHAKVESQQMGRNGKKFYLYLAITGNPTVNTLKDIADIIGCQVGDFFKDEGDGSATVVCPHCGKPVTVELK